MRDAATHRVRGAGVMVLALSTIATRASGQVAAAGGPESPIFLTPRAAVAASLNTVEKSATFSVLGTVNAAPGEPGNFWLGVTASGKAQNGFAGLVSGDDLARDAQLRMTFGFTFVGPKLSQGAQGLVLQEAQRMQQARAKPNTGAEAKPDTAREREIEEIVERIVNAGWIGVAHGGALTFDVYGRASDNRIADSTSASTVTLSDEKFRGAGTTVGLGLWSANLMGRSNLRVLGGVSAGIERASNAEDLKEVRIDETRTTDGSAGGPVVTVTRERKGLYGDYAEFTQVPVTADLLVAPIAIPDFAIHVLSRTQVRGDRPDPTRLSLALYLLKDRNPLTPQGGIVFKWDDAFHVTDTTDPRFSIGVLLNVVLPRVGP